MQNDVQECLNSIIDEINHHANGFEQQAKANATESFEVFREYLDELKRFLQGKPSSNNRSEFAGLFRRRMSLSSGITNKKQIVEELDSVVTKGESWKPNKFHAANDIRRPIALKDFTLQLESQEAVNAYEGTNRKAEEGHEESKQQRVAVLASVSSLLGCIELSIRTNICEESRGEGETHRDDESPNFEIEDGWEKTRCRLEFNESVMEIRFQAGEPIEEKRPLVFKLARKFARAGKSYVGIVELQEEWERLGGVEPDPSQSTIYSAINKVREQVFKPLGCNLDNAKGVGWRIEINQI